MDCKLRIENCKLQIGKNDQEPFHAHGKWPWPEAQGLVRPALRRRRLNLLDLQSAEGYWSLVGQTTPDLDSTAERVVWIDEIHRAVCCE